MTINTLAREIALTEGKKSQTKMGDVKEILSLLSDLIFFEYERGTNIEIFSILYENGKARFKKSGKSKPKKSRKTSRRTK